MKTSHKLRNALNVRRLVHPHDLRRALYRNRPRHSPLDELLHLRPQLRLSQRIVIDRAGAKDSQAGKPGAAAKHERPTRPAKVVGHGRAGAGPDGPSLGEAGELVLAAGVAHVGVGHGDVGLVEGRADLAAVCAVADVPVDETWLLQRLEKVEYAAH